MSNKGIKIGIGVALFLAISAFGIYKYTESTADFQYGTIPEDFVVDDYEEVTYTIPTIDEDGERNTQEVTIKPEEEESCVIRLLVRDKKVKDHTFVTKEDVPKKILDNLPTGHF
ncbi:MAG TPA: hypothetical protein VK078_00210 [Pseudogracilibacillus sp.]|nr:hypothetical protein [Pseudogracilibacillus sp.]